MSRVPRPRALLPGSTDATVHPSVAKVEGPSFKSAPCGAGLPCPFFFARATRSEDAAGHECVLRDAAIRGDARDQAVHDHAVGGFDLDRALGEGGAIAHRE